MTTLYIIIVGFMLLLAVFDLFVGVSNDAVNFLNSAIGAKVAKFRTVLIIASAGIFVGALMSAGMMDVARHGVLQPANCTFHEVMMVFIAVMVTDVIILDLFNTLGLPTSTTVSLIFDLLGGVFVLGLFKIAQNPDLTLGMVLNSDKVLTMIVAIFVSVGISLVFGFIVQHIARLVFTFNYRKHLRYTIALFGGISFTFLSYFILVKGFGKSPVLSEGAREWIAANQALLIGGIFVVSTILSEILHLFKVNIFKVVVLLGTFALAMAFSSNDLVNFIGVPLAGLDSFLDWHSAGAGDPNSYMMVSLMESAKAPMFYLIGAGVIMIIAMTTSKKAHNVIKTSIDLSRQDEGDEMFGSSKAARSIVRITNNCANTLAAIVPKRYENWANNRFDKSEIEIEEGAAFDVVRAAVNLVLASALIIIGTVYKLPLSTTYVTFMVAMGTSLADRAWSRESAVFRVTGVLSVIGGWLITAAAAFICCAVVASIMLLGGFVAAVAFMILVIYLLYRSNRQYKEKMDKERNDNNFSLMMRSQTPELVFELLTQHVSKKQSEITHFIREQYNGIVNGLQNENIRELNNVERNLKKQKDDYKKNRKREYLALRRVPREMAIERNTWFHLAANSTQQYIYCLKRMLEPIIEHVDNNFNPMPKSYVDDYAPIFGKVNDLFADVERMIADNNYDNYDKVQHEADEYKNELSLLRKRHIDRMHYQENNDEYKISLIYLNLIQETQELLSIMRHQLRAANKFVTEK